MLSNTNTNLLNYLANELLPIFDSCGRYYFEISFDHGADQNSSTTLVTSLLQLSTVAHSSYVIFSLRPNRVAGKELPDEDLFRIVLPVDAISKWLHNNADKKMGKSRPNKNVLRIYNLRDGRIQNELELIDHLKQV